MRGTVEVVPATATDVPSQAEIDTRAQQELATLQTRLEQAGARAAGAERTGPNNTKLWRILAGNSLVDINDGRVQLSEFVPKDVTIQTGDTVIWESRFFHSVTFVHPHHRPTASCPSDSLTVQRSSSGIPSSSIPPACRRFRPGPGVQLGHHRDLPGPGITYALTFETPGIFKYFCGIHRDLGMEGTIIVQQREARSP